MHGLGAFRRDFIIDRCVPATCECQLFWRKLACPGALACINGTCGCPQGLSNCNDVCVDEKARIWFTDPRYGDRNNMEMPDEGVYRIDPDGRVARVLTQPAIQKPNGITVSPDCKTLYVADSNDSPGGNSRDSPGRG